MPRVRNVFQACRQLQDHRSFGPGSHPHLGQRTLAPPSSCFLRSSTSGMRVGVGSFFSRYRACMGCDFSILVSPNLSSTRGGSEMRKRLSILLLATTVVALACVALVAQQQASPSYPTPTGTPTDNGL